MTVEIRNIHITTKLHWAQNFNHFTSSSVYLPNCWNSLCLLSQGMICQLQPQSAGLFYMNLPGYHASPSALVSVYMSDTKQWETLCWPWSKVKDEMYCIYNVPASFHSWVLPVWIYYRFVYLFTWDTSSLGMLQQILKIADSHVNISFHSWQIPEESNLN